MIVKLIVAQIVIAIAFQLSPERPPEPVLLILPAMLANPLFWITATLVIFIGKGD